MYIYIYNHRISYHIMSCRVMSYIYIYVHTRHSIYTRYMCHIILSYLILFCLVLSFVMLYYIILYHVVFHVVDLIYTSIGITFILLYSTFIFYTFYTSFGYAPVPIAIFRGRTSTARPRGERPMWTSSICRRGVLLRVLLGVLGPPWLTWLGLAVIFWETSWCLDVVSCCCFWGNFLGWINHKSVTCSLVKSAVCFWCPCWLLSGFLNNSLNELGFFHENGWWCAPLLLKASKYLVVHPKKFMDSFEKHIGTNS